LAAARRHKIGALLDTGSLAGDFVSQRLVDDLRLVSKTVPHPSLVCSGLNNQCVDLHKKTAITVSFINEITLKINTFDINAFILKDTTIDLIVGLPTIKKYSLFQALPSLVSDKVNTGNVRTCTTGSGEPALVSKKNTYPFTINSALHASLLESADRIFGDPVQDLNDIPAKVDSFEPWLKSQFSTADPLAQINISGSHEFRAQIICLCEEFRHLFSDTLPSEPAKLKPFDIIVDDDKWDI
jgi:hypothetical protein